MYFQIVHYPADHGRRIIRGCKLQALPADDAWGLEVSAVSAWGWLLKQHMSTYTETCKRY